MQTRHTNRTIAVILLVGVTLWGFSCAQQKNKPEEPKQQDQVPLTQSSEMMPPETPKTSPIEDKDSDSNKAFGLKTVHFDLNRSNITLAEKVILNANVQVLKNRPELSVLVEGHCDQRGSSAYNFVLGQKRADSVKRYLVANGVAEARISTVSYGKSRLLSFNETEVAYAENRRGNFRVTSENYYKTLGRKIESTGREILAAIQFGN